MKNVYQRFQRILLPKQKRGIVALIFVLACGALLDTASLASVVPLLNAVTDPQSFMNSSIGQLMTVHLGVLDASTTITILSFMAAGLFFIRGAYKVFSTWLQTRILAIYRTDLSLRLFRNILNQPYSYHLQHSSAEVLHTLIDDVLNTFFMLDQYMLLAACLFTIIGIVVLLFSISPVMMVAFSVLIGTITVLTMFFVNPQIKKTGERNLRATTQMYEQVRDAMGGLKSILINQLQHHFVVKFTQNAGETAKTGGKYAALNGLPKTLVDSLSMAGIFAIIAALSMTKANMNSIIPSLATFALAATRLLPIVGYISDAINITVYRKPSLDKVYDLLCDVQAPAASEQSALSEFTEDLPSRTLENGIDIQHLSFQFEQSAKPLYTDISVFLPTKKSIAFVGQTGSGKTTLLDIILGLLKPTSGHIYADGHDINQHPLWWSKMVSYIPQNIFLLNDTIRNNITFGHDPSTADEDAVWSCIEKAQLSDFVRSLPDGLNTITGENGVRLSGGQRQRIGIARALYLDAPILVMDEATSAIDHETERALIDAINALAGEKTLLIVAHRLSTIENCDFIYLVENGSITLQRSKA